MLVAAGCSQDPTGASNSELVLAQQAQLIAQDVATSTAPIVKAGGSGCVTRCARPMISAARAFLDQAVAYRDSARAALAGGDTTAARAYWRLAFRSCSRP